MDWKLICIQVLYVCGFILTMSILAHQFRKSPWDSPGAYVASLLWPFLVLLGLLRIIITLLSGSRE